MGKTAVLMVGVDKSQLGGIWSVTENYINSETYNNCVDLTYVATSTKGNKFKKILFMIKGINKCKKVIKNNKIDIVHLHMSKCASTWRKYIIVKYAKKHGVKCIIHFHAGEFLKWYSTLSNHKKKTIGKLVEKTDSFLVLGNYWKKELSIFIPLNKMDVVYNGVCVPKVNYYNIDSKNVVFFGILKKDKGVFDLVDAVCKIDASIPENIKFKLCGPDYNNETENYIKSKDISNRFILTGWVSGEEKQKILKDAMINVLPSYFEALSMTLIEAMAYGIPMVTTKISTMEEVLGYDSTLFQPGDIDMLSSILLKLINNSELRKELSEKEYERVKSFDINENIKNTLLVYNKILSKE